MSFEVHDPGGNGVPLTEMWAWVSVHGEGEQSITGLNGIPLVAQQESVLRQMEPLLRDIVRQSGKPQRLVRFHQVTVVDQIDP